MRQNCDTSGTRPEARGGCETALRLTQTALFRKMAEIGRRDKPAGVPHRTSHKNSGNPAPAFPPAGFSVVGVGASAGGLAALERFFQALPPGPGLAFVVIQHLSPDYKSMMASILSKYTPMAVAEGEEGMAIAPNHVYLIPPGKTMTVEKGRLHLTAKSTQRGLHLPIDAFFSSLAREYGERAIAVVLSGTGSDGSRGIRAIKEADGLVLVQEPKSAEFDGMPSAAAATGLADFVLAPEAMPEVILNYARRLPLAPTPPLGPEGGRLQPVPHWIRFWRSCRSTPGWTSANTSPAPWCAASIGGWPSTSAKASTSMCACWRHLMQRNPRSTGIC